MILEELIGVVVSLSLTVITHAPPISRDDQGREYSLMDEQNEEIPEGVIHREYEQEDVDDFVNEPTTIEPILVERNSHTGRTVCSSLLRSLQANIGLIMGVVLLGLFNTKLVYIDLSTTNSCIEWKHFNQSVPSTVKILQTVGPAIASFPIYTWFPINVAMLWGYKELKRNYQPCLSVSLVAASICMACKVIVGQEYYVENNYSVIAIMSFVVILLFSVALVTRKCKKINPTAPYSFCHIFLTLSFTFITATVAAYFCTYVIIIQFKKATQTVKTIITALSPGLTVLPIAIGKYLVLRKSWKIISLDRAYVLCYCLRGGMVVLFRTLQTDFHNIWIFIGLSLVHGFSNISNKATLNLRIKLWKYFIRCVNKTHCGSRLKVMSLDNPRVRRLNVDLEIQYILFEYTSVILSQCYLSLYLVSNFDINPWQVIQGSLIRIAISLAIDFLFNIMSVFILIHFQNFPLRRVWLKCWRRHLFANIVVISVIFSYFSLTLVSVFEAQKDRLKEYTLRNCTSTLIY